MLFLKYSIYYSKSSSNQLRMLMTCDLGFTRNDNLQIYRRSSCCLLGPAMLVTD